MWIRIVILTVSIFLSSFCLCQKETKVVEMSCGQCQFGLTSQKGCDLAVRFDRGDEGVSLSDVMIARNKSSVAFDATIQVRNKLVDAYKALMNMPV